jgi:ATP-binding cassette subfamily C protein LapB
LRNISLAECVLNTSANPQTDPLLECLALVAALLSRAVPLETLRSSFAVDDDGLIPVGSYPELARKHGMLAAWTRSRPTQYPSYLLPVVVPFIDGRACVLREVNGDTVKILLPESGATDVTMTVSEIEELSTGEILVVKAGQDQGAKHLVPFKGEAFEWFWGTLWRFRGFYVEAMVATVLANVLALASIFFTMNVYDRVVPTQAYMSLWTLAIGTLIAALLEFLMRWLKVRLVDLGGKNADMAINATLLREVMNIRLEHRPQSIGVFVSSMRDFEALRDFFSSASLVTLTDLPFIFLFLGLIWVIAGPLALVPAIAVPLLILVGLLAQRPLTKAMRENMAEAGQRQSVLVESLMNLELLKAHNAEGYLQRRWEQANLAGATSYKKTRSITNLILNLTSSTQQVITVAMVVFGVYLIHSSDLTLGGLIASVILAGRAIAPLGSVMSLAARYQQAVSALDTLDALMKRPRDREVTKKYIAAEKFNGALTAESLEFAYPGEHTTPVLKKVSLQIEPNDRLAILGKIGSGKSTLLRLLSGLYQPLGGTVRVDGLDLQQIDPATLRSQIGYVGQESQLFMGTLRENLVLSDLWISDTYVIEVLKKIDLYPLVSAHPRGLDMELTEGGGGLSGGQRQLLAIGRMMLRNPRYVFMDEPTSHMDQGTEGRVIQILSEWLKDRTVVLSTHRPQLLVWVNKILVMDKGVAVALGPRDEILKKLAQGVTNDAHRKEPAQTNAVKGPDAHV